MHLSQVSQELSISVYAGSRQSQDVLRMHGSVFNRSCPACKQRSEVIDLNQGMQVNLAEETSDFYSVLSWWQFE